MIHSTVNRGFAAGGSSTSPTDILGKVTTGAENTAAGIGGTWDWVNSVGKTFTNNSPTKADYQVSVITIVIIGLFLALLLVSATSVAKIAAVVK